MVKKQRFTSVLLLLIIVFILGVIAGNNLANGQSSSIDDFLKQSELSTDSYLLEQQLFKGLEKDCDLEKIRLADLSQELWQLGKLLGEETSQKDLEPERYEYLKKKYHLMQLRTFLLYKRLNDECEQQSDVILFYFSKNNPESQEQGEILDGIVEKQDVTVFAVELNYSKEIEFVERYYVIKEAPSLVINFETIKEGLTQAEEIEELIK